MPSSRSEPVSGFHLPPFGWLLLSVLLLCPWGVVLWLSSRGAPSPEGKLSSAAHIAPVLPVATEIGRPGPWGRLEYARILIEPTENFVPQFSTTPRPVRWFFHGYSDSALDELWQKAGLDDTRRQVLNDPANRERPGGDLVVVRPPEELVLGLSEAARATIYAALAVFQENGPQNDSYRIHESGADQWLDPDLMSPSTLALVRPLLYRRGHYLLFSDQDIVLARISSADERLKFVKNLSRRSALLAQLRVAPGEDTETLARYWGRGRRSKDLEPLLTSLARRPGGGAVDIVHLLPAFARALLYTYPVPSENPDATARDCHWTSLNFYNTTPDDRFLRLDAVRDTILRDYQPFAGEPALGDIVMLVRPDGAGVHSCVYVADGIVFTKNGPSSAVPWLLSRLEDVTEFYALDGPLRPQLYRAKAP
jgi:hypothetical protein